MCCAVRLGFVLFDYLFYFVGYTSQIRYIIIINGAEFMFKFENTACQQPQGLSLWQDCTIYLKNMPYTFLYNWYSKVPQDILVIQSYKLSMI